MAIAAPARRSAAPTAPAPARTEPPEPKKRPRDRPRPGGRGRSTATATTTAPARKQNAPKRGKAAPGKKKQTSARAVATAAPARKKATSARSSGGTAAPARKAPARRKVVPRRRTGGVIPIAAGTAGRAAVAVTQLPESGLIYRLTRGRAWIGLLGVLLVGIVALNVVTLSFAASAGKVDERIQELSKENSSLQGREAEHYGQARVRHEAGELGLAMSTTAEPVLIEARKGDVAAAAERLAAAAPSPE
jgi:hypothetical protein